MLDIKFIRENLEKDSGMLFILSGAFQPIYDSKKGKRSELKVTRDDLESFGVSKEILGSVLESVSDFTEGWLKNNLFILSLIILLILLVIYIIWALWLRKK